MSLYFVTGSKNKFDEVKLLIPNLIQLELDLPEIQELDAHKIIANKLSEARLHHKGEFMVEDTSLYLNALNGLPGPFIKWFLQTIGCEGLYKLAQAFGNDRAEAKTIIGYTGPSGETLFFEGSVTGRVVEPRLVGSSFGWDAIFLPDGENKTFSEMSREEKNVLSMRAAAAKKLMQYLQSQ